jgi:hypothetical protein
MTYFVAAVAASGIFILAGWRSKQAHTITSARVGHQVPADPLWDETEIDPAEGTRKAPADTMPKTDTAAALRVALRHLAPVMANRAIQADVAAASGIMAQISGPALVDLLEEMISAAINAAPASRLLLTAAAHDGNVFIGVTDDMPVADADVRRAAVRGIRDRALARGGNLDVIVRPYEGTTITLRLDAAPQDRASEEPPPVRIQDLAAAVSFDMSR